MNNLFIFFLTLAVANMKHRHKTLHKNDEKTRNTNS